MSRLGSRLCAHRRPRLRSGCLNVDSARCQVDDAPESLFEFRPLQRLLVQQDSHQIVQHDTVHLQDFSRALVLLFDQAPSFGVDDLGSLFTVVTLLTEFLPEEHQVTGLAVGKGTEFLTHAIRTDHAVDDVRGALEIVRRSGRDASQEEFLGSASAEQAGNFPEELLARAHVPVFCGQLQREPEGHATRHDTNAMDLFTRSQSLADDGMPGFMIGDTPALVVADDPGLLLWSSDDLVDSFLDLFHRDIRLAPADGKQRALVQQVFQVGSSEAGGLLGDRGEHDVSRKRLVRSVYLEDLLPSLGIRQVDDNTPIEATRTQQSRVQNVRPVRGRKDDNTLVRVKTVHLDEQLVQGLLTFVVAAADAAPRWRPTASISSMNTMHGAYCFACANRSLTRLAPTPTNISTNSEPDTLKNGTLASPEIARASSVFPQPGGPTSNAPLGIWAPITENFFGFLR